MSASPFGFRVRGNAAGDVTLTVDTFMAEVPLDPRRSVLVYLRRHGGREFVRWRVFHRHSVGGNWYPDRRRAFVVPSAAAGALGHAIASASRGNAMGAKPEWLAVIDTGRDHCCRVLKELNAPASLQDRARRDRHRGWCLSEKKRGEQ